MIETLTDADRAKMQKWAEAIPAGTIAKALRCIDQQVARAKAAEAQSRRIEEKASSYFARADAAEQKLAAANQDAHKQRVRAVDAEARVRELEGAVNNECSLRAHATDAALEAQSELAQLRERVAKALAALESAGIHGVFAAKEALRNGQ